jgi:hypothetical protein
VRRAIVVVALALVVAAFLKGMAQAGGTARTVRYTDSGFDPNDVPIDPTSCCQQDPDIRSSTRRVWADGRGRRWLTVSFGTYDLLDDYWTVRVLLDTRGGPRYDATMSISDAPPAACSFRWRGSTRRDARVRLTTADHAFCRVPLGWAMTTKRIRWRLFSRGGGEGTGPAVDEHAPDMGWYH